MDTGIIARYTYLARGKLKGKERTKAKNSPNYDTFDPKNRADSSRSLKKS
jgi:hypothetical protein